MHDGGECGLCHDTADMLEPKRMKDEMKRYRDVIPEFTMDDYFKVVQSRIMLRQRAACGHVPDAGP